MHPGDLPRPIFPFTYGVLSFFTMDNMKKKSKAKVFASGVVAKVEPKWVLMIRVRQVPRAKTLQIRYFLGFLQSYYIFRLARGT